MSDVVALSAAVPAARRAEARPGVPVFRAPTTETPWVRGLLILAALAFLLLFLLMPLAVVFAEAFRKGAGAWWTAISEPDAVAAMRLTLLTAAIAVPVNLVFGVAAAWAVAKF